MLGVVVGMEEAAEEAATKAIRKWPRDSNSNIRGCTI